MALHLKMVAPWKFGDSGHLHHLVGLDVHLFAVFKTLGFLFHCTGLLVLSQQEAMPSVFNKISKQCSFHPRLVVLYRGFMKNYPVIFQDYFISHDIRIPSLTNQDSMECHVRVLVHAAHLVGLMGWRMGPWMPGREAAEWTWPSIFCWIWRWFLDGWSLRDFFCT